MKPLFPSVAIAIFALTAFAVRAQNAESLCPKTGSDSSLSHYAGRYRLNNSSILTIYLVDGQLVAKPLFWRSEQPMKAKGADHYVHEEREGRQIAFYRNEKHCIASAELKGFGSVDGIYQRLTPKPEPLELLFAGLPGLAAKRMVKNDPNGSAEYAGIARQFLRNFPSKRESAAVFLNSLAKSYPHNATILSALGDALVANQKRESAEGHYLKALAIEPANEAAVRGLRRLNALPATAVAVPQPGWKVPFPLDEVFRKPARAEIAAVESEWAGRDLSPKGVSVVATERIMLGNSEASVRIVSHLIHGQKHFGAVIVPAGVDRKAPVILDLKGVSWNYSPLDLAEIISPRFLGADRSKFIYVIPLFRGEILKFGGVDYISEGDRADSWDGAADDALALLNAALSITPQADETRIGVFGKSRGGSVALLAGVRDKRIKAVLDWSGPTDWFELMATEGWTQKEIITDGLLNKSAPNQEGGQVIERFLQKAIDGKWGLREARQRMLASSPLYFADRLPLTQAHYGTDDEMVPLINGQALFAVLKKKVKTVPRYSVFYHENSGHDLNQRLAFRESRKFLIENLLY